MKSFEKFQYDTSPYVNEEIEELDEISLVGMVRAGGQAIKNVATASKNLIKKTPTPTTTPTLSTAQRMSAALDKPEVKAAIKNKRGLPVQKDPETEKRTKLKNIINNQSKKVERVQQRSNKKINTAIQNDAKSLSKQIAQRKKENLQQGKEKRVKEFATTRNLINLRKDPSTKGFQRAQQNVKDDPSAAKPSLMTRIKRLGYKDPIKAKKLIDGGISSKLARNVGSVAKAVGKGLAKNPTNKIAYNAKGDGYGGAFGNIGDNIKSVGQEVLKAPTFSSTTKDKKTGEIKPGEQVGTVGDKISLTALRNRNVDTSQKLSKTPVTTGGGNEPTQSLPPEEQATSGGKSKSTTSKKAPTPNVSNQGRTINKVSVNTTTTKPKQRRNTSQSQNPDYMRRRMMGAEGEDSNTSSTEVTPTSKKPQNLTYKSKGGQLQGGTTDIEGNPIDRFSRDKQAYVTYNTGRRMVDANPNLKDQLTDKQIPANPRTKDEGEFRRPANRNNKNNNNNKNNKNNNNEEFTPKLFEQFLSEIDTKSTKKKKKDGRGMHPHDEIKPMSGTNTITINPEDESSKYKRGY